MKRDEVCELPLLLTGAVSTRGMKGAMFSDEEREAMYAGALDFYISKFRGTGQKIVFAENSGWDLNRLRLRLKEGGEDVEWISLDADEFDVGKGKGYNEMLIINKAVERSECIRRTGRFMKATGRYPIYNLPFLLTFAKRQMGRYGAEMVCDLKDHKIYDWIGNGYCGHSFDCRLFACSVELWKDRFAATYTECDDYAGKLMEGVMFENVSRLGGAL